MSKTRVHKKTRVLLSLLVLGIAVLWLPRCFQHAASVAANPHTVHIAFGFHVNLYHSFRGDSADENGFGQDIRVIRDILGQLDRLERQGIAVRAVWDFDNLFSLQEILPLHAPDIIRHIQRRVRQNQDEVILMSYNNGLVSAMNQQEFDTSIERAISNAQGSGVQDLFGRLTPVVRPQEMMTTTGNFEGYQRHEIPYAALYYSATPFDAFRLFSRELTPLEAYNPIQYRHPANDESMIIIPTYHAGDLVEHVSLREWAASLHELQNQGRIKGDALIFLNFDADSQFWSGADLPWHLQWLPNTGGLSQLAESVADLDFVKFTTLGAYLADHPPVGTVQFSQDTADGSFHGYHSWAEKSYVSGFWTRIMANRRAHEQAEKVRTILGTRSPPADLEVILEDSYETRLRALSTTNFGLAGPFLVRQREAAVADLLDQLDGYTQQIERTCAQWADAVTFKAAPPEELLRDHRWIGTFLHLNRDPPGVKAGDRELVIGLRQDASPDNPYVLTNSSGRRIPARQIKYSPPAKDQPAALTLGVTKAEPMPDGIYFLLEAPESAPLLTGKQSGLIAERRTLKNEQIRVALDGKGRIEGVFRNGKPALEAGSLLPYIRYRGRQLSPEGLSVTVEQTGAAGVASVRIQGPWQGPAEATRQNGWIDYRFRLVDDRPYLFVEGTVHYPDTHRQDVIGTEKPMLARKIDAGWEEVAPLELRVAFRGGIAQPFYIHKRNFLGREAAYAIDYHRHAADNLNLASINNHITAEYAAVTAGGQGMAVAMNTDVRANFAFCPFKMRHVAESGEFQIRANPFGTYHGEQMVPPTHGNGLGYQAVLLSAPQFTSAAPTYNGYTEHFALMLAFFDADIIPPEVKSDLISFARPPMILGVPRTDLPIPSRLEPPEVILPPAGFMALAYQKGILFHWESVAGADTRYRIRVRAVTGARERALTVTGTSWFMSEEQFRSKASGGGLYAATIEARLADGRSSSPSREIYFRLHSAPEPVLNLPARFKAKVVWASVQAWISRNLL